MRFTRIVALAALVISTPALAQRSVPPAAPTIGASGGIGAGIAMPAGALADLHTAGYAMMGLVDFSAAEQPFSFRTELVYQHYDAKQSAPPGTGDANLVSLGASLLLRTPRRASSAYLLGGIGIYHGKVERTKPGVNIGAGLEVPLTYFVGFADLRVHYMLTEGKPTISIPITLGARF
jgi:hypothetical protein